MRLIHFVFLILPLAGMAQADTLGLPPFSIKIMPLNLINPVQQSLDVLADMPIAPRWAIELGLGAIVGSGFYANYIKESYLGLKIMPALKYYLSRSAGSDIYLSLDLKCNIIQNKRFGNVLRQGGQYSEWMLLRKDMRVLGIGLRFGTQEYFGRQKRWVIEPFCGLGLRQIQVDTYQLPPDGALLVEGGLFTFDRQPGIFNTPDLRLGFHLGRRFTRRR